MSPPSSGSPASSAQWHAVTPQTRPLSIAILELAPTSVTLALTRSPPGHPAHHHVPTHHIAHSHHSHSHGHGHGQAHLHSHSHLASSVASSHAGSAGSSMSNGHTSHISGGGGKKKKKKRLGQSNHHHPGDSDEGADDAVEDDHGNQASGSNALGAIPGAYPYPSILAEGQTFKDMLSHGVVVTLDGMPWSRIVAHVSDDADDEDNPVPGTSEDDDGEWEDDWEHAGLEGGEEGLANTSSTEHGQLPRRRRRHRASDASRHHVPRRIKVPEKHASGPRWDRERAVVVVYDLDPSKEHEIELQIVGLSGEVKDNPVPVSNAVLIPPASPSSATLHPRSRANSLRSRSRPRSRSNSVNTTPIPPVPSPLGNEIPASPNRSTTPMPDQPVVPTSILSPIDAQTAQTRHLIAAAHAEREHLQARIKEARKTAQRSEAALRTEIESMKRSNEKAGGNDQRNKQKYLALQEQVKQGWAGAEAANKEAEAVKNGTPDIEGRVKTVTAELEAVRVEWKKVKEREEEARDVDKKMRADEDKRMAELDTKIEKLRARKEKKDGERAELLKKLEELEKQRGEVERKGEENKAMRRTGYYPGLRWDQNQAGPGGNQTTPEFNPNAPNFESGRTISPHPSMSNLHQANNNYGPGTGFRRGGFQHRYPSGGSRPPPTQHAQHSPTINQTFFPSGGAPGAPPSPAWQAKTDSNRTGRGSTGPNPAAAPFLPASFSGSGPPAGPGGAAPFGDPGLHTAFMPPQLQHRIYLPNSVRPRPTPNFHPPPSVLAEQQAQASSSSSSSSSNSGIPAAFPPLPATSTPRPAAGGPSLASIVTRAVLAPTSALAAGSIGPTPHGSSHGSAPGSGRASTGPGQAPAFSRAPGSRERIDFPPLSPSGASFQPSPPRTTPPQHTTPPPVWSATAE